MTHLTQALPFIPNYGYSRLARYRSTVIEASSGRTYANQSWEYPLHIFGLPLRGRKQAELEQILSYFHAAAGRANTFDFLDFAEDRTCSLGTDPANDDVTLGTATASQTDFQLIKTYTTGSVTRTRKITRPIDASWLIAVDGTPKTITTDYTIEAGGILRFNSGLTGGEVVTGGGRFYVPVRFGSDEIDVLIQNFRAGFIGDAIVDLYEVRE